MIMNICEWLNEYIKENDYTYPGASKHPPITYELCNELGDEYVIITVPYASHNVLRVKSTFEWLVKFLKKCPNAIHRVENFYNFFKIWISYES